MKSLKKDYLHILRSQTHIIRVCKAFHVKIYSPLYESLICPERQLLQSVTFFVITHVQMATF